MSRLSLDRDFEVVQRLLAMDTRTSPDRGSLSAVRGCYLGGGCGFHGKKNFKSGW